MLENQKQAEVGQPERTHAHSPRSLVVLFRSDVRSRYSLIFRASSSSDWPMTWLLLTLCAHMHDMARFSGRGWWPTSSSGRPRAATPSSPTSLPPMTTTTTTTTSSLERSSTTAGAAPTRTPAAA